MIFYLIIFFTICYLLYQYDKKQNSTYVKYAFAILFVISAVRFDVGYDYMTYYHVLTDPDINFRTVHNGQYEPGNIFIFQLSRLLHMPQLFFIISSYLITFLTFKSIKAQSVDYTISTLLFLSIPIFYFNSLSVIRQFIAVAIVLYASTQIINKQYLKYMAMVLIAILFHKSAAVALLIPIFALKRIKFSVAAYITCILISFWGSDLIVFLAKLFLDDYYIKFYLDNKLGIGGDKILLIFQAFALALLFIPFKRLSKTAIFHLNLFFVGVAIWGALSPFGHAGMRGALYFIIFIILLAPAVLNLYTNKKLLKQGVYVLAFVFLITTLYLGKVNPFKDPNLPYRVSFFTDKTIYKK